MSVACPSAEVHSVTDQLTNQLTQDEVEQLNVNQFLMTSKVTILNKNKTFDHNL